MSDLNEDDLQDGIVRIVPEGEEVPFRDRFEAQLMSIRTNSEEGWRLSQYREPKFMNQGISALHRKFGNCGRRKARSAAVRYGFRAHQRRRQGDLNDYNGLLDRVRAEDPMLADKLSYSHTLTYARRGNNRNAVKFYIESNRDGLIVDIGEVYGFNRSQLCRHYVAVALYDAGMGTISEAAKDYVDGLWKATELQEPDIQRAVEHLEENGDG